MIRVFLQLCSNNDNDTMEENSFIKAFRLSFDVRGGMYMFPIVMLLEILPYCHYILLKEQFLWSEIFCTQTVTYWISRLLT